MIVMYVYAVVITRYQRDTTPLSSLHLTNLVYRSQGYSIYFRAGSTLSYDMTTALQPRIKAHSLIHYLLSLNRHSTLFT